MATYTDNHGDTFVKVGKAISGILPLSDGLIWIMDKPIFDPVPLMLDRAFVDLGIHQTEATLGMWSQNGLPTREQILVEKPQNFAYSGPLDYLRYGNVLSNFAAIGKLLRGESLIFTPDNEQEVRHITVRGDLGPRPANEGLFDDFVYVEQARAISTPGIASGWSTHGPPLFDLSLAPTSVRPDEITFSSGFPSLVPAVELFSGTPSSLDSCLAPLLNSLVYIRDNWGPLGYENNGYGGSTHWYRVQVHDFLWSRLDRFPIDITYTLVQAMGHNPESFYNRNVSVWNMRYRIDFDLAYSQPTSFPSVGTFTLQPIGTMSVSQRAEFVSGGMGSEPMYEWTLPSVGTVYEKTTNFSDGFVYTSNVSDPQGMSSNTKLDLFQSKSRRLAHDFRYWVMSDIADIRLAALPSTASALDDMSQFVENNLIEALNDIREISGLLPELADAIELISAYYHGQPILTVKAAINLITSLQLYSSFSFTPNMKILEDTLPKMERAVNTMARLSKGGTSVARGEFFYEFAPETWGRNYVSLTARSKVVMSLRQGDVLIKILGVDALGILPRPSRIFESLPLSFVLTWVTGIAPRMRDIESLSLLTLLNIQRFVHSFRIDSPLQQEELEPYGVAQSLLPGSIDPSLRVYVREVSNHVPRVADGKFDFRLPGRAPPWWLSGSLAWQLAT